ncbi:MAG: PD40 domain-containing protein [Verrucomicrobiales bacterium]|nr:PD40 domain-containing protein [Verrucomicrobiales bacterium]
MNSSSSDLRRTDTGRPARSCRLWLVCACLLLAGREGVARPADQPEAPADTALASPPRIAPDYVGVVLPPNVAPLNFTIQEAGSEYRLRLSGTQGPALEIRQLSPGIRFPQREWQEMLSANQGTTLRWEIAVRDAAGRWIAHAPFETRVAGEAIDPYVTYRRLKPLYSTYKHLGIYQRNIETFDERPILRNEVIGGGCVNCHTPQQGSPDRFAISFRGRFGTPTLVIDSNRITRIDSKLGYLAWHPNGRMLAFGDNQITQFFHTAGPNNRDVFDARSDLGVLHLKDQIIEKPAPIARPGQNENWPSWAPDGRYLYYCSSPTVAFENVSDFRYDLLRIPYDPEQNLWGEPEVLLSSAQHHLSFHQPRVSPDGRFLVLTVSASGSFPLFRSDSNLWLLRLATRELEPLPALNSPHAETWHCWSSNGHWLLFGSRRLDGVFARLFITHVDSQARFSRPLLLPQEDPDYYQTCLDNFNAPELARGPVQISEEELARAVDPAGKTDASTDTGAPIPYRP